MAAQQHQSFPERTYASLLQGLFGLGFTFSKDVEDDTKWLFIISAFVAEVQTISFALNDSELLPWRKSKVFAPVVAGLSFLSQPFNPDSNPTGYLALLAIAAVFVATFLALAFQAARNFARDTPQAPYLIRALRLIASASTGVLFLPVAGLLLRGASCPADGSKQWLQTQISCGSPTHVVLSVIFSVLTMGFTGLSLFVSAVFVDRRPTSPSWAAVATGRAAVINISVRLVLSFCYSVIRSQVVGTVGFSILLTLIGLAKVYQYGVWAPFTHRDINAFFAASGGAFAAASSSLLVAQYLGSGAATLGIFFGVPMSAALTFSVISRRLDAVARQPLQKCQSVHDMHLWGRRRLQRHVIIKQILERIDSDADSTSVYQNISASKRGSLYDQQIAQDGRGDEVQQSGRKGGDGSDTDASSVASLGQDSMSSRRKAKEHPVYKAGPSDYRGVHLQSADSQSPHQLKVELAFLEGESRRAYEGAAEAFPTDELAFIGLSIFERTTSRYRYRECVALAQALRCSPPLDSRFYVAQRVRDMRESDGFGLSSVDRVLFDSALRETSQLRLVAYQLLVRIFGHLTATKPDLADLLDTGVALHTTVERADEAYRRLFGFNSDNATLLRQYAGYLTDFRADPLRVNELLQKAQRVEEQTRRQKQKVLRIVKFGAVQPGQSRFDESAAIITISAAPFRLGEILHASQSACRLFNYASHQMIGQNVSIVVPHPLDSIHDQLLQAFSKRNRRSRIVGRTRLLFGRRKGGTIMPIWLAVNEAPPDQDTAEPRFTAEISAVTTDQNFVLFGGPQHNFKIFCASAGSLRLLGLEAEDIDTDVISMTQYFQSVDSTYQERAKLSTPHIKAIASTPGVMDLFKCLGRAEIMRRHQSRQIRVRVQSRTKDGRTDEIEPGNGSDAPSTSAHFVQGSGKVAQIKEATTGPCANEVLIQSMQHLQKPGLIPVRTRSGEALIVGQMQVAHLPIFGSLNILGWHSVPRSHADVDRPKLVRVVSDLSAAAEARNAVDMRVLVSPEQSQQGSGTDAQQENSRGLASSIDTVAGSGILSHTRGMESVGTDTVDPMTSVKGMKSHAVLGSPSPDNLPGHVISDIAGGAAAAQHIQGERSVEVGSEDSGAEEGGGSNDHSTDDSSSGATTAEELSGSDRADATTDDEGADVGSEGPQPGGAAGARPAMIGGAVGGRGVLKSAMRAGSSHALQRPSRPSSMKQERWSTPNASARTSQSKGDPIESLQQYQGAAQPSRGEKARPSGASLRFTPGSEKSSHSGSGRDALSNAMALTQNSTESQIVNSGRFLVAQGLFVMVIGIIVTVWTRNYVGVLRDVSSTLWLGGRRQLAFLSAQNKLVWQAMQNDLGIDSHYVPSVGMYAGRRLTSYNLTLVNRDGLHQPDSLQQLMLLDADEVQDAHSRLYVALEHATVQDDFEITVELPILLPRQSGGGTQFKTTAEQLQELVAALRRVAKSAAASVSRSLRDVEYVLRNAESFDLSMAFASKRLSDTLDSDIQSYTTQVWLFGAITTGVLLCFGASSFILLLRQLGYKTDKVLRVFMLISQGQAKRLVRYSQKSLERVLAETQSILEEASTDEEDDFDDFNEDLNGSDSDDSRSVIGLLDVDQVPSKGQEIFAPSHQQSADIRELQNGLKRGTSNNPGSVAAGSVGSRQSRSSKQARMERQSQALSKAKQNIRAYTNSSTFVCRSIVCLLMPVSAVLLYAGALLLIQDSLSKGISLAARRIVTSQSLEAKTLLLSTQLQQMARSTHELAHASGGNASALRAQASEEAIEIAESTRVIEQVASMLALGGDADSDRLLFSNVQLANDLFSPVHSRIHVDPIRENNHGQTEADAYVSLSRDGCINTKFLSTSIEDIVGQAGSYELTPPVSLTGSSAATEAVREDCEALQNGVIAEGLVSAFASLTFQARDLAATVYANLTGLSVQSAIGDTDLDARRRLLSPGRGRAAQEDLLRGNVTLRDLPLSQYSRYEVDKLRDLFLPYMQHGLDVMTSRFFLDIASTLEQTGRLTEIATWVFVGFFLVTTIVYMSQMQLLQLPLRSARQMLILLPQPLIAGHLALQAAIKEITREMQSGTATDVRQVGPLSKSTTM